MRAKCLLAAMVSAFKRSSRFRRYILIGMGGLAGLILAGFLLLRLIPLPGALFQPPVLALELVDRQGHTLREVSADDSIHYTLSLNKVPQSLIEATLAAEDSRFWRHHGVDPRAVVRAAWSLVKNGRIISGGSTITQQLIKLAQPRPRTFFNKLVEAIQALRLETVWGKERILCEYLQRLEYGNSRVGASSAARFYFDQPLARLSTAQSAFLAGLPQAPSRLNPHRHFARSKKRQEWILGRLQSLGYMSASDYRRCLAEPIQLVPPLSEFKAPHFVDLLLRQEAEALRGRETGSLVTSLDLELQSKAEKILRQQLERLRQNHVRNGALVVIENNSGQVLALVGSGDYFEPVSGQVNGAWAPRSAGSTFKPFTYLIAFEQQANPASLVADVPTDFPTSTGVFTPANYNHHCYGPLRYRLALANSLNIPAVKVLDSIGGPEKLLERMRACGLTTLNQPADHYGLGLTIGNAEARLLELANAYACLARLGKYRPYTLLAASPVPGQSLPVSSSWDRQVFAPEASYLVADILSDNRARALAFGIDSSLRFDFPVACKTGTSTDFRDNWAMGFTPEFTVGVWIGNFDGTPMEEVSGVTGAAPVLHQLFLHLHQRYGTTWYHSPPGIIEHDIHPITGKRVAFPSPGVMREKFIAGRIPPQESPGDYDLQGRVKLPSEYRAWLLTSDNWLAGRVVIDEGLPGLETSLTAAPPLRITSPLPGTKFSLDPDLPDKGAILPLHALGNGRIAWRSSTLNIQTNQLGHYARLVPGHHQLTASDLDTGSSAATWISVEEN